MMGAGVVRALVLHARCGCVDRKIMHLHTFRATLCALLLPPQKKHTPHTHTRLPCPLPPHPQVLMTSRRCPTCARRLPSRCGCTHSPRCSSGAPWHQTHCRQGSRETRRGTPLAQVGVCGGGGMTKGACGHFSSDSESPHAPFVVWGGGDGGLSTRLGFCSTRCWFPERGLVENRLWMFGLINQQCQKCGTGVVQCGRPSAACCVAVV